MQLKSNAVGYKDLVVEFESFLAFADAFLYGITMLDLRGKIICMDEMASAELGYIKKELIGAKISRFIMAEDRSLFARHLKELFSGHTQSIISEYRLRKKGGGAISVSIALSIVRNSSGHPKHFVAGFRNISKSEIIIKQLQHQLLQTQKMEALGVLAGGISHDFNNILTSIIGYAQLSIDEEENGPIMMENLKYILDAGLRAKNLIQQIVTFSRPEKEDLRPVLMTPIIKETLKFLTASLPADIKIRRYIKLDRGIIQADPSQIQQILVNLCMNAAQAMDKQGGILKVSATNVAFEASSGDLPPGMGPGSYLKLSVADTGCGIPPEHRDKIFDPYFTTKDKNHGTGLGLSVVLGIVKKHDGAISIDTQEGYGTTVNIFFPVSEKKVLETGYTFKAPSIGKERILLVDDEKPIINIGQRMLGRLGYSVVTCDSGIKALTLFRSQPDQFDLVITDMTMPDLPGDRLAGELMKIRPEIPIVLCTGHNEKISKDKTKGLGIRAFIMKPFTKLQFTETIRGVLDGC